MHASARMVSADSRNAWLIDVRDCRKTVARSRDVSSASYLAMQLTELEAAIICLPTGAHTHKMQAASGFLQVGIGVAKMATTGMGASQIVAGVKELATLAIDSTLRKLAKVRCSVCRVARRMPSLPALLPAAATASVTIALTSCDPPKRCS
eukprot:7143195-Prymnesium_polylepis.2